MEGQDAGTFKTSPSHTSTSDNLLMWKIWGEGLDLYMQTCSPDNYVQVCGQWFQLYLLPKKFAVFPGHQSKTEAFARAKFREEKWTSFKKEELSFLPKINYNYSWECRSYSYHLGFFFLLSPPNPQSKCPQLKITMISIIFCLKMP